MREERIAGAAIAATMLLIAVSIALVTLVRPAEAVEFEPDWTWKVYPQDHTNMKALVEMRLQSLDDKLKKISDDETARLEEQAAWEAEQAAYYEQTYAPTYVDYGSYSGGASYGENSPTRYMPGYYNGHKETYYSSNVLYHSRTPEWTVDDEGFYRTDEGYYVVGVGYDEYTTTRPAGTLIETGKGTAIVCDTGYTNEPIVDFYTNW